VLGAVVSLTISDCYHRKALRQSKVDRKKWLRDFKRAKDNWMEFQLQNALHLQNNAQGRAWDVQLGSDHASVLLTNLQDSHVTNIEFAELGSARLIRADAYSDVWSIARIEAYETVELRFSRTNENRKGFIMQWTDPSVSVPAQSCYARFTQALYYNPFELFQEFPKPLGGVQHGKYHFHTPFPIPYRQLDDDYVRENPGSTIPPFPRDFMELETGE